MMNRHRRLASEAGFTLVELLVVMVIMGLVATAVLAVVRTTARTESYTNELRTVMDEGRVSIEAVRRELRGSRRVIDDSTASLLHFWVDQNQDGLQQLEERVYYVTETIAGAPGKYRIRRYTEATGPGAARTLAETLVNGDPFSYDTGTPTTATRDVRVVLDLDVRTTDGPDSVTLDTTVRLRNVA